jgi:DNA-binding transcriptional LysR family regulator
VLRLKDLNGAISWRNVEEQRARQQAKGGEVTDDWQLTMYERYWTFSADLMDDGLACVVRSEHPEIGDTLSPEQYEAMKHVNVLPPGRMRAGLFQALQQRGLKRDVAVSVTHFLAVPEMVAVSDYCSTLPRLICKQLSRDKRLKVLPSPVDLGTFPVESVARPVS